MGSKVARTHVLRKDSLKYHLPEERGIPCRFLDALAFLDTHLHSRVGVHLSEQESHIGKVNSPLGLIGYKSVKLTYFKLAQPSLAWMENGRIN